MRQISGFEPQVIEALEDDDPTIEYQAVRAAGEWGFEGAWPHVTALISAPETSRPLLLAAIKAAAIIRPDDAKEILSRLLEQDDEEISDAVYDALVEAGAPLHGLGGEEEGEDWFDEAAFASEDSMEDHIGTSERRTSRPAPAETTGQKKKRRKQEKKARKKGKGKKKKKRR